MTTLTANELPTAAGEIVDASQRAMKSLLPTDFEWLESQLQRFESLVRESHQAWLQQEANQLVGRLEGNDPLTPRDTDVLRSLIVGDAQCYVALENNVEDWKAELTRLIDEVRKEANQGQAANLMMLHGLLMDAVRTAADLRNFYGHQNRLERFEQAMANLTQEDRELLAQNIRGKLDDPYH
jgi:hypothetical protein